MCCVGNGRTLRLDFFAQRQLLRGIDEWFAQRRDQALLHILITPEGGTDDATDPGFVRTEFFYDPQMNRVAVKSPEAVSGAQPANIETTLFDERDLPYKVIRGDSDVDPANAPPATAVVETINHDPNRNLLEWIDAIRNAVSPAAPVTAFPGSAAGDVTALAYDGFDRRVKVTDAEGNVADTAYDPASNVTQEKRTGPVDHTTGAPVRVLRQTDFLGMR